MTAWRNPWMALWLLNVALSAAGQIAFKAAAVETPPSDARAQWIWMARRPWIWLGLGCFLIHFVLWLGFLSLVSLARGMMLGSLDIVMVFVVGRHLFRERASRLRLSGVLLIAAGVSIVAAFA